jgi:hypothetical protein
MLFLPLGGARLEELSLKLFHACQPQEASAYQLFGYFLSFLLSLRESSGNWKPAMWALGGVGRSG